MECTDGVLVAKPTSAVVKVSAAALGDKVLANLQDALCTFRRDISILTAGTHHEVWQCFCSLMMTHRTQAGDEQPITDDATRE